MESAQKRPYLERLDHLRFYAAALVLLFHFFHNYLPDLRGGNMLVSLIDEGHTGIALFMVISGFIFTVLAGHRTLLYGSFIRNRFLRIYPLFIVAVCLQLMIGAYNDHLNHGALQLIGWLIPFRSDTVALSPQFAQLWTIWVEFQFYLIFPFLLYFVRQRGIRYLYAWLLLLLLIRCMVFAATGSVRFLAYETIFGRLDQFLVGMLLGLHWNMRYGVGDPIRRVSAIYMLPAAMLVLLVLHGFSRWCGYTAINHPLWIIWPPIEGAMWGLVLWLYMTVRAPRLAGLAPHLGNLLANLGTISFSIYVWHNLVIHAWKKSGWLMPVGELAANVVVTAILIILPLVIALSTLTYWLIERPFLGMRGDYLRPTDGAAGTPNP